MGVYSFVGSRVRGKERVPGFWSGGTPGFDERTGRVTWGFSGRNAPQPHGGKIVNPTGGGSSTGGGSGVNQSTTQPATGLFGARINWIGLAILALVLWWLLRKG